MHFMFRTYRKENVCKIAVIFHPRVLYHKRFNFRIPVSSLERKAVVPAGNIARCRRPDHMDPAHTRSWIFILLELVIDRRDTVIAWPWDPRSSKAAHSHPFCMLIQYRRLHHTPRNILFWSRQHLKKIHDLRCPLLLCIIQRKPAHSNIGRDISRDGADRITNMRHFRNKGRCIRQRIIFCPHIPFDQLALVNTQFS